jgi:8-oxo-dGTP pyrophosphatase MutT (NUDIX family)
VSDTITGMSTGTWESHLESRGNPMLEGTWGDTPWGFYEYGQEVPSALPIRTSMCVPVCSLDSRNPQVMLTLNLGRGGYEIPGGHLDPLRDGEMESAPQAAARETPEETGLHVESRLLIPYGYIEATNVSNGNYPRLSYMQLFGAYAPNNPDVITDPEVDGAGIFTINALRRMTERGAMKTTEFALVCSGIRAVFRHHGLPDEHITMS